MTMNEITKNEIRNEAFYTVMEAGSCIIDVSSMVSYMVPALVYPLGSYRHSRSNQETFMKKMMARVNLFPKQFRQYLAYAISKNFVIWYAKRDTARRFLFMKIHGASKAAVKLFTEGLRSELADSHVRVTVVLPGAIATNIKTNFGLSVDAGADEKAKEKITTPGDAARIILNGVEKNKNQVLIGPDAIAMDLLCRVMPDFAAKMIRSQMRSHVPA
jgi:NAD(P)-dependent dehydrogenase (short-subunit alcohol dehydrogenase family)